MNEKEQRSAIAEACGWTSKTTEEYVEYSGGYGAKTKVTTWYDSNGKRGPVPDYLNDLNAMHEAEKVLMNEQIGVYLRHMSNLTSLGYFGAIHATAAQRAEAFLKALNLWKD